MSMNNIIICLHHIVHPCSCRTKHKKASVESDNVIEMQESLHEQASTEGSLTARRRWKKAGKLYLDQIAQTRNASMDRIEIETPFSAASRMDSIQEGLSSAEPVPITPKYIRTLDKIQERQKRLARQVSTTVEAMKSIEESVVGRILQHPNNTLYTHSDAMKLYNDHLTSSIEAITKHHRPPRRSTVGDISRIRPVSIAKIRAVASLRLQETSSSPVVEQNTAQAIAEAEKHDELPSIVLVPPSIAISTPS